MNKFERFRCKVLEASVDLHPSELHGMVTGYLCSVKSDVERERRRTIFAAWVDAEVSASFVNFLDEVFMEGLESLGEFSDFDFSLIIPSDDESIAERVEAVSLWCSGFLSGYGESGRQLSSDDASDVKEALLDLSRIASMSGEVPEGEENESDLTEIVEFVRISTLLIFAATG